jgi:hypothetical protein
MTHRVIQGLAKRQAEAWALTHADASRYSETAVGFEAGRGHVMYPEQHRLVSPRTVRSSRAARSRGTACAERCLLTDLHGKFRLLKGNSKWRAARNRR